MSRKALLALLGAALVAGLLVLSVNPAYRIERNLESNAAYYPETAVATAAPEPTATPEMVLGDEGT